MGPADAIERLGIRARIPVFALFDGAPYRGPIVPMGGARVLGVPKAIREAIGKAVGEPVHVVLERDEEPRDVEVPGDLTLALAAEPQAKAFFEGLSYTHRKEYVQWIVEAKRAETRERRVRTAVEMLGQRQKTR